MMDVSMLSPAPWEFSLHLGEYAQVLSGGCPITGTLHDGEGIIERRADAEFICLARAAFDVMMRRCWWTVPGMDGKNGMLWKVETCDDHDDNTLNSKWWPDPFTALVEADRLLKEQEEK